MTTLTLPATRTMTAPRPLKWTCKEFHRFGDMGVFEGRGAKLIHGVIIEEGPMNPPHALTLEVVSEALLVVFGKGWRVRVQSPLVLDQDLDPMPDFAVVAGSARTAAGHLKSADLVAEVADSSLSFDTNEKRIIYATAGIREYWVVDINGRRLLVYRDPSGNDYASKRTLGPADDVSPLAVPTATVKVADLLV